MTDIKIKDKYGLFINGEWSDASDGGTIDTFCPFTGEKLASIAQGTKEDVDRAVSSAWDAWDDWKKTTPRQRAEYLNKIADIIDENKEYLAKLETLENGKSITETMNIDIPEAADHFRYFASAIRVEEGSATFIEDDLLSIIVREPIGVVGQIVPWNFPFLMAAWKLAPVLATGCCTVFNPSSSTSLSVLALAELIQDVLPKGVFNVVTGSGSKTGQAILDHPDISKLAFTGSTEVGRKVGLAAAEKLIPSTLELGGKSAHIFFPDLNEEKALESIQMGIVYNQGQVCSAGSRLFIHEDIYDEFLPKVVDLFENVVVGDPLDPKSEMGTLISEKQLNKVKNYIDIGVKEGAKIATGGNRITDNNLDKGFFLQPTLLVDVTNDMTVAQEEIFGPVAVVIKFKDEQEVIDMANDSDYGLGGGVWTQDINRAFRVAKSIQTGRMWVNTYNQLPAGAPFGGYKDSGIGRETHKSVMNHYSQVKNIMINTSDNPLGFYTGRK
ncbi:MAG TPA: aldehyde dehydrogenase family protein [Tissierellaceae bacterium]